MLKLLRTRLGKILHSNCAIITNMEIWATELTRSMEEIEHKLKEAEKHSGKNDDVNNTYKEAVDKVSEAKTAISRFIVSRPPRPYRIEVHKEKRE